MIIDWFTVAAQVINFLVLVALLKYFLYQPILTAVEQREKRIANELAEARAAKLSAEQVYENFEQKKRSFEADHAALYHQATVDAQVERQRLIDVARQEAEKLSHQWQAGLVAEYENLNREIVRQAQAEIFALTRKVLADLADEALAEKMVALFVRRLNLLAGKERDHLLAIITPASSVFIRSSELLSDEQRVAVVHALQQVGLTQPLTFVVDLELIAGIELVVGGYKLAWSISDYLGELEVKLQELAHG